MILKIFNLIHILQFDMIGVANYWCSWKHINIEICKFAFLIPMFLKVISQYMLSYDTEKWIRLAYL